MTAALATLAEGRAGVAPGIVAERPIDFCVIGAQKCATSALYHFLGQHPDIQMSRQKEVHFFDAEHNFASGRPDYTTYHRSFPTRSEGKLVGEATPIYIFWPNALERLAAYNPDIRLVAIFRDPVDRAYSHWRMMREMGRETLSFSAAIRSGRDRLQEASDFGLRNWTYVERGFYGRQVQHLRSLFPDEQILFLRTEDLRDDHERTLRSLFAFLGLPFVHVPAAQVFVASEPAQAERIQSADAAYLSDAYRDDLRRFSEYTAIDTREWASAAR